MDDLIFERVKNVEKGREWPIIHYLFLAYWLTWAGIIVHHMPHLLVARPGTVIGPLEYAGLTLGFLFHSMFWLFIAHGFFLGDKVLKIIPKKLNPYPMFYHDAPLDELIANRMEELEEIGDGMEEHRQLIEDFENRLTNPLYKDRPCT